MSQIEGFDYRDVQIDHSQWSNFLQSALAEMPADSLSGVDTVEVDAGGRRVRLPVALIVTLLSVWLAGCLEAMQSRDYFDTRGLTAIAQGAPPAEVTATMAAFDTAEAIASRPPADMYADLTQESPGRYPAPGGPAATSTSVPPQMEPTPTTAPSATPEQVKPPEGTFILGYNQGVAINVDYDGDSKTDCQMRISVTTRDDSPNAYVARFMDNGYSKPMEIGPEGVIGAPDCGNAFSAEKPVATIYRGSQPGPEIVELPGGAKMEISDAQMVVVPNQP